jgi:hypothetical protein
MPPAGLLRFSVALGARVTLDGSPAELRDLQVGHVARVVTSTRPGGMMYTERIEAFSKGTIPEATQEGGPERGLKTAPERGLRPAPKRGLRSAPGTSRKRAPEKTGPVQN